MCQEEKADVLVEGEPQPEESTGCTWPWELGRRSALARESPSSLGRCQLKSEDKKKKAVCEEIRSNKQRSKHVTSVWTLCPCRDNELVSIE